LHQISYLAQNLCAQVSQAKPHGISSSPEFKKKTEGG